MRTEIDLLLQIQEKDISIRSLQKERQQAPEELEKTKNEVEQADNLLKEKQEELKRTQVAHKELEMDLDTKLGNVDKYDKQLFQIKTNEEYKALKKEIHDLKFAAGLQEDKILEKMEEVEKTRTEIKRLEKEVNQSKEKLKQHEKEVEARLKDIDAKISQLQKEKEDLMSKVPEDLKDRYSRIFENKPDAAIVPIENKSCGGCHIKLPPNVINEVKKARQPIICENCARILYWSSSLEEKQ